jgi:hypothetical protein
LLIVLRHNDRTNDDDDNQKNSSQSEDQSLIFPDSRTDPMQFGSNPRALEERRIQQPSYLGTKSFIVPNLEEKIS